MKGTVKKIYVRKIDSKRKAKVFNSFTFTFLPFLPTFCYKCGWIEIIVWVAIGGRGTLFGAILGAILVNYAKTFFTGALPEAWLYVLGISFILSTIFLPKGIVGTLKFKKNKLNI